jgi:hypothetical protein
MTKSEAFDLLVSVSEIGHWDYLKFSLTASSFDELRGLTGVLLIFFRLPILGLTGVTGINYEVLSSYGDLEP